MKKIISILFLLSILITTSCFAQLEKANKYYDHFEYAKAIELYRKVLRKKDNTEALEKISNALRLTRNYEEAEVYYARLMKQPDIAPVNHFNYGIVLKNNNKIEEARQQFVAYSKLSPNDKKADKAIKSCDDIKSWVQKTQQFDVTPVTNINTEHSEFCPVLFDNKLVFTSNRTKDILNDALYSLDKQPFLNEYYIDITDKKDGNYVFADKVKAMDWPINTAFHDGPISFTADKKTVFITRVNYVENKKDENFINRPKIYIATAKGNSWGEMQPFTYNSDSYSVAHPSISADGQYLFFTSDMPGGYGGTDIYVSKKGNDIWGTPQNLGEEVNTIQDEAFPTIRNDGVLFFSSDGHSGFGGLDIFSATMKDGKYTNVTNIGAPINSSTDDFGIAFTEDNTRGYFSSDRTSGKGADDIYHFITLQNFISMGGKLLLSQNTKDPAKFVKVNLIDENGNVIMTTITDSLGQFRFEKLPPDKKYLAKLDENDPSLRDKEKVYMTDENNKIIRVTVVNEKGERFVFYNLPSDANELSGLVLAPDVTLAGNLLSGQNPTKPLTNTKINLVNEKGEIVGTTITNAAGGFVFKNLSPDKNYMVKVAESDTPLAPNTKITITDRNGKKLQTTITGDKGQFNFELLAAEINTLQEIPEEDNSKLRYDFKGSLVDEHKSALANSVINLVDEDGNILETTRTDSKGNFIFNNLPVNKQAMFSIEEKDTKVKKYNKLFVMDTKGNTIKEFSGVNGKFTFELLPAEQKTLAAMEAKDAQLVAFNKKPKKTGSINDVTANSYMIASEDLTSENAVINKDGVIKIENIYFAYGKYDLFPESQKTLDKIIHFMKANPTLHIELSSYTDSRSTAAFNMKLSQLRAKSAVDYIIAGGIPKENIKAMGYGETKPVNQCSDGVECSEEEHYMNRRTEFKIINQ